MELTAPLIAGFAIFILVATVVDLWAARHDGPDAIKAAAWWSVAWMGLGLGFGVLLWVQQGSTTGQEYLAGYLIERALSLDNLFVFSVVFAALAVPRDLRPEMLIAGILIAIVLRAILIAIGAEMLETFWWTTLLFGGILVLTGVKMLRASGHVEPPKAVVWLTKRESSRKVTALLIIFGAIAVTDVVFAIDSIPAVFAVTDDPLVVLAANVFALVGLRSLYVVLEGMLEELPYLPIALAVVLIAIGIKMTVSEWWHAPAWLSLLLVVGIIGTGVVASLISNRRSAAASLLEAVEEEAEAEDANDNGRLSDRPKAII